MRHILIAILFSAVLSLAYARIVFLEPRPKLTYEGVVYRPDDTRAGIIQAFDAGTEDFLWEKRLYDHFRKPLIEPDVVWKYFDGIFLDKDNHRLLVVNTNNSLFSLDLETKDVMGIELTRGITIKIDKGQQGSKEFDELLVLNDGKVMMRLPSTENG